MKEDKAMLLCEALTSDKYKQTGGELHAASGHFCVMGVACDVSGVGAWNPCKSGHDFLEYKAGNEAVGHFLPVQVITDFDFFNSSGRRRDGSKVVIDGIGFIDLMRLMIVVCLFTN